MGAWIHDKIAGFFDGIVDGIKDFFGIESPSKLMRDQVGKNLALGIADGITENADAVDSALQDMADDIADTQISPPEIPAQTVDMSADFGKGTEPDIAIDRFTRSMQLNGTVTQVVMLDTGTMEKLDQILGAIEDGKVIALDGDKLVGGTADRYNSAFGEMQILTGRSVQ